MAVDFKAANERLTRDVEATCKRYGLNGVVKGDWLLMPCPWRIDRHPSFVVNRETGRWKDMAYPESRGDMIDLIARVTDRPAADIVKEVCGG